ncbi:MAG: amidohydrolase family protein, partial [Candidatus Thorarchaeota archaeon]
MTTDVHTHLGKDRNSLDKLDIHDLEEQVDLLISRMDHFGIEKAVLTPINPFKDNELNIEAAAIYPDRLFTACTLLPRPIESAQERLKYYIDQGCVALVLDDRLYAPEDPAALMLIREAVDHDVPIYIHNYVMTAGALEFIDKASQMFPKAKLVILHMGGLFGFPQLIPLMARQNIWLEISITLVRLVESPLRVFLDAVAQDIGVRKLVFGSEHHSEYL